MCEQTLLHETLEPRHFRQNVFAHALHYSGKIKYDCTCKKRQITNELLDEKRQTQFLKKKLKLKLKIKKTNLNDWDNYKWLETFIIDQLKIPFVATTKQNFTFIIIKVTSRMLGK